jgi:ABC-type antimicrobial peptide transport system permease subunit
VKPLDGVTLVGASVLIVAAAMIACVAPAVGVARLDPVASLRSEA